MPPIKTPSKSRRFFRFLLTLTIVTVLAYVGGNYFSPIFDHFKNLDYTPPANIEKIMQRVNFTERGQAIFKASRPALEESEAFNQHCKSHNPDTPVLGCYTNQRVYLYNIKSDELPNIVESTAAHETLHAAWSRLPIWEQLRLSDELKKVYEAHKDVLAAEISNYPDDFVLDELHSRIGTEIADLPPVLEQHYAKYFKDQDAVVAFYNSYSEPFLALSQQIKTLTKQIVDQKRSLDQNTSTYYANLQNLNQRIDEFNRCATSETCVSQNPAQFQGQHDQLVAEQLELTADFNSLNAEIQTYNQLVNSYNQNILHSKTLERAVNSNKTPKNL